MQNNVKKTQVYSVAVSLCTCKRPKLLKKALASIEKINIPENLKIEILVVDNDVEKSAEQIVLEHQKCSNYVIHYSVEPKRGLSYARNKTKILPSNRYLGMLCIKSFSSSFVKFMFFISGHNRSVNLLVKNFAIKSSELKLINWFNLPLAILFSLALFNFSFSILGAINALYMAMKTAMIGNIINIKLSIINSFNDYFICQKFVFYVANV